MAKYYSDERNVQILISVMKAHGVKKIIASPGTTNICFVASVMQDPFFELYSAPEERSAAYMACGMAAESGETVAIVCTGATASRNYMPGLTEAYYRQLPILAITASRRKERIGHNIDQVTDRTNLPNDIAKISVQLSLVYDEESEWGDVVAANKAILEIRHHGIGPVHINLETNYSTNYSVKDLPKTRIINRFFVNDELPVISKRKVAIYIGAHSIWSEKLTNYVDLFCEYYNAAVICDHIGNYMGKYKVFANLQASQIYNESFNQDIDLLVHIGNVSSSVYGISAKEVWRVNADGEIKDTFRRLSCVFEMEEEQFFQLYVNKARKTQKDKQLEYFNHLDAEYQMVSQRFNECVVEGLPFSNIWIASQTIPKINDNYEMHFGILNSLRSWSFFKTKYDCVGFCNTGGFGIDGSLSSVLGASLVNSKKIYLCILGDLAFFYDMNALGNRHIGRNIRILLVNNGKGSEFRLEGNPGSYFGEQADDYIAAGGHYGCKSSVLVKHYVEDLGFKYLTASNKEEYVSLVDKFLDQDSSQPILFEVFTESEDENLALKMLRETYKDMVVAGKAKTKNIIQNIVGESGRELYRKLKK